jgi:hypothetical protein
VIRADVEDNVDLYGKGTNPRDVVMEGTVKPLPVTETFTTALRPEK